MLSLFTLLMVTITIFVVVYYIVYMIKTRNEVSEDHVKEKKKKILFPLIGLCAFTGILFGLLGLFSNSLIWFFNAGLWYINLHISENS